MRAVVLIGVLVLLPAVASAQQPCDSSAPRIVDTVYQKVLERSADQASAEFTQRLANGSVTVRGLVRELVLSPEHRQRFMSGSPTQAVTYLYRHVLGREPDPEGLRANVQLYQSRGPEATVDTLLNSAEYRRNYGDEGVPGARGLRFCGPNVRNQAANPSGEMRFRGMDRNNDGVITREEWRGSRASFVVHDWNGDDVLSGDEVRPGAERTAASIDSRDFDPSNADRFDSWSRESFANLDHNRDGRISSNEWHYDAESFRRADRNGDGSLTVSEFTASAAADDREDRFENLDANRDGRVDRSEWHGSADAFDWLDRNSDNVLSRAEVVGNSRQAAADQFASLDVNRDGRISQNEWHWSRRSFDVRDTNGDGALTRAEFRNGGAVPTSGR